MKTPHTVDRKIHIDSNSLRNDLYSLIPKAVTRGKISYKNCFRIEHNDGIPIRIVLTLRKIIYESFLLILVI